MSPRFFVCRLYAFMLGAALLTLGSVALLGHMIHPGAQAAVLQTGTAGAIMLAGGLVLAVVHRKRLLCMAVAGLTLTLCLVAIEAPWQTMPGLAFMRIQQPLVVVLALTVMAAFVAGGGRRVRGASRFLSAAIILLAVLSHLAYAGAITARFRLGHDTEAAHFISLFVLLLGIAVGLFPALLKRRVLPLQAGILLVGLVSVVLVVAGGYLLAQVNLEASVARGDQPVGMGTPRDVLATSLLPALVVFCGLGFGFLLALSQQLSRLAGERARHLGRANRALTRSLEKQESLEAFHRRIMQFSMDVLCSIDEQGRFTDISPSSEKVFGYRPEEMKGRKFIDFVLPEDRERTLDVVKEGMLLGGGASPHFRNRYRHKDGHTVHVMWSATWAPREQAIFAIARDITQLVRSEAITEGQRNILEMVATNRPLADILQAICCLAEAHLSDAHCHIDVGSAKQGNPSSMPPSNVGESLPIHGLDGDLLGRLTLVGTGSPSSGSEQDHLIDICRQLASIALERELDRASLDESEQRYRSLFAFNPHPVFSFDPSGRITSINRAGCALSGFTEEALLGQHFSSYLVEAELPGAMTFFQAALAGEPQRYETQVIDREGGVHDIDVANLPIIVGGRIVGVFGIGSDITERKAAERALRSTLGELERSNRELQDFAFVASHDLQEPLRKIQVFSGRLETKAEQLDSDARDYLHRMVSAANRMQVLIRDLLAYSRIGTQGHPFAVLDLNRVVAEVLQDLELALEANGAHVEVEALPSLQGDETQIRQLLQNLLANALKFHKAGEPPRVKIHAERSADQTWALCISDRGIGFDEKYRDAIFQPFHRLHDRQHYTGTGIGLAIVKKIAERHGARVGARSRPGQGATFCISFPMMTRNKDVPAEADEP